MFELAMNDQMHIATNKVAANPGHCGSASCGNRGTIECVNRDNSAGINGDYLYIEGAYSLDDGTGGGVAGGKGTADSARATVLTITKIQDIFKK